MIRYDDLPGELGRQGRGKRIRRGSQTLGWLSLRSVLVYYIILDVIISCYII